MAVRVLQGDCRVVLASLPAESVHCCVTSPPYYGLRDYGVAGQIGLEPTPDAFIAQMVEVFREVRRVLRADGTLWLNLGDSYAATSAGVGNAPSAKSTLTTNGGKGPKEGDKYSAGNAGRARRIDPQAKPKDLLMIPARVALALQADGWWLRSDIIWSKPNPMPESVTDRPTSAHEHIFLLSKSERYFFDAEAVKEAVSPASLQRWGEGGTERVNPSPQGLKAAGVRGENSCGVDPSGRNIRNVWTVATQPFSEAHFATFPPALIEPCIKAGCPEGGTVLDPFGGAGTTGLVADRLKRNAVLIELNPEYAEMARRRIQSDAGMFAEVA